MKDSLLLQGAACEKRFGLPICVRLLQVPRNLCPTGLLSICRWQVGLQVEEPCTGDLRYE